MAREATGDVGGSIQSHVAHGKKGAWHQVIKAALALGKPDRILLAIYMVALWGLLMFPIAGPGFRLLGIESDKWMHIALFGGLAVLLRWNFSENRHAILVSIGAAFVVAAVTEIAQGLVAYRSAELLDLVAGFFGAILGATTVDRILSSPILQRLFGLLVVMLGLMVGAFFLLADVIGVGDTKQFGLMQLAGMALGAVIASGGVRVYLTVLRGESHLSQAERLRDRYADQVCIVALMSFCAALLAVITHANWRKLDGKRFFWLGLTIVFVFLAIDEGTAIHEEVSTFLERYMDARGALHFLWVIPYGVMTLILGLGYLRFVWTLPKDTRARFVMAGVIFLTGALGIEMLGAREADLHGYTTVTYCFLYSLEEMLEMLGIILFIYALLLHLAQETGRLSFVLDR